MASRERKSTTILAMDVVGYSAKMSIDEASTVLQLKKCRGIIEEVSRDNGGRIFNTAGDAFMIEFPTTVGAVESAVLIQKKISLLYKDSSDGQKLEFRSGINMGDVTVDGGNLLGDGVNIAARLEGIAPPSGICVSEVVYTTVKNKLDCSFIDKGYQKLKNISDPVRVYYADIKIGEIDPKKFKIPSIRRQADRRLKIGVLFLSVVAIAGWFNLFSEKKEVSLNTIVVLPIETIGEKSLQKNFAAGLTQDLSNGLRGMARGVNIITLSEVHKPLREIAELLGASYFLRGSLRHSDNKIRFSVSLIDAESLNVLWSENIDSTLTTAGVFQVQDTIVNNVIQALVGTGAVLEKNIFKKAMSKGPSNFSAYECVNFTRIQTFVSLEPADYVASRECLENTVQTDPSYALAWIYLALVNHDEYAFGYNNSSRQILFDGLEHIATAIQLDPNSGIAYAYKAHLHFQLKDWEATFRDAEKAIELEPNNYLVLGPASQMILFAGDCTHEMYQEQLDLNKYVSGSCRWQKGYRYSLKAAELDRGNTDVFENYSLSQVYTVWGEYQLALDQLMMVTAPEFYYWNIAVGVLDHASGRQESAKKMFDKAADLLGGRDLSTINTLLSSYNNLQSIGPIWNSVLPNYGWK